MSDDSPKIEHTPDQLKITWRWIDGDMALIFGILLIAGGASLMSSLAGVQATSTLPSEVLAWRIVLTSWPFLLSAAFVIWRGSTSVRIDHKGWTLTLRVMGIPFRRRVRRAEFHHVSALGPASSPASRERTSEVYVETRRGKTLRVCPPILTAAVAEEVATHARTLLGLDETPPPEMPRRWSVRDTDTTLRIVERPAHWRAALASILPLAWLIGAGVGATLVESFHDKMDLAMALIIGGPFAYLGLGWLLNRRVTHLDPQELRSTQGPIPLPSFALRGRADRRVHVKAEALARFEVHEALRNRSVRWYTPIAITTDGEELALRRASHNPWPARYLVHTLNARLDQWRRDAVRDDATREHDETR